MELPVDLNQLNAAPPPAEASRSTAPLGPRRFQLSSLQRILLATPGTVTDILETYSGESIVVSKLFESIVLLERAMPEMELEAGHPVYSRKILLQGAETGQCFLYAESSIVLDRLEKPIRDGLLTTNKPIGLLMREERMETFRDILDYGQEPAGELAGHFRVEPTAGVVWRTYRMLSGRRPVMLITEKFPESHFLS
jgi:chorismate-pyruvate lyase